MLMTTAGGLIDKLSEGHNSPTTNSQIDDQLSYSVCDAK